MCSLFLLVDEFKQTQLQQIMGYSFQSVCLIIVWEMYAFSYTSLELACLYETSNAVH